MDVARKARQHKCAALLEVRMGWRRGPGAGGCLSLPRMTARTCERCLSDDFPQEACKDLNDIWTLAGSDLEEVCVPDPVPVLTLTLSRHPDLEPLTSTCKERVVVLWTQGVRRDGGVRVGCWLQS